MPRGRPVVNRLELNAEQTASLKAIANSRSEELSLNFARASSILTKRLFL